MVTHYTVDDLRVALGFAKPEIRRRRASPGGGRLDTDPEHVRTEPSTHRRLLMRTDHRPRKHRPSSEPEILGTAARECTAPSPGGLLMRRVPWP